MWLREILPIQMLVRQQWQWRRRRKPVTKAQFGTHVLWVAVISMAMVPSTLALRCYTDVLATKSRSVECGLNTGCVKIFIDSEEMLLRRNQQYGYAYPTGEGAQQTLPEKYMDNPILLRGCFVLAVPDRCYTANNGLTYCWCSQKDLCNRSPTRPLPSRVGLVAFTLACLAIFQFYLKSFLLSMAPS